MSLARKYRIVPTSSPWVSEDDNSLEANNKLIDAKSNRGPQMEQAGEKSSLRVMFT